MNQQEVAELLTVVAAYDRRTLGEVDVITWHGALGDLQLDECKKAVVEYYRTSTDWLMPANVRKLALTARQDAAMRQLSPARDDLVPMPDWFRSSVEEHRRRARSARGDDWKQGDPTSFGDAIVKALDRMPR